MRRKAREIAFMLIYEEQFNKDREVGFSFDFLKVEEEVLGEEVLSSEDNRYIEEVLKHYTANKSEIEIMLNEHIYGYETDRVYKIDKALLYLAIIEIVYIKTAPAIVINEIIEVSKIYSTDKSAKFINGILGTIIKKLPK